MIWCQAHADARQGEQLSARKANIRGMAPRGGPHHDLGRLGINRRIAREEQTSTVGTAEGKPTQAVNIAMFLWRCREYSDRAPQTDSGPVASRRCGRYRIPPAVAEPFHGIESGLEHRCAQTGQVGDGLWDLMAC